MTIVQGETGSGKTTQVAQYILDSYRSKNCYCNIIVTQPRRIAAISIAKRVCAERNWIVGQLCGYQVSETGSTVYIISETESTVWIENCQTGSIV